MLWRIFPLLSAIMSCSSRFGNAGDAAVEQQPFEHSWGGQLPGATFLSPHPCGQKYKDPKKSEQCKFIGFYLNKNSLFLVIFVVSKQFKTCAFLRVWQHRFVQSSWFCLFFLVIWCHFVKQQPNASSVYWTCDCCLKKFFFADSKTNTAFVHSSWFPCVFFHFTGGSSSVDPVSELQPSGVWHCPLLAEVSPADGVGEVWEGRSSRMHQHTLGGWKPTVLILLFVLCGSCHNFWKSFFQSNKPFSKVLDYCPNNFYIACSWLVRMQWLLDWIKSLGQSFQ